MSRTVVATSPIRRFIAQWDAAKVAVSLLIAVFGSILTFVAPGVILDYWVRSGSDGTPPDTIAFPVVSGCVTALVFFFIIRTARVPKKYRV